MSARPYRGRGSQHSRRENCQVERTLSPGVVIFLRRRRHRECRRRHRAVRADSGKQRQYNRRASRERRFCHWRPSRHPPRCRRSRPRPCRHCAILLHRQQTQRAAAGGVAWNERKRGDRRHAVERQMAVAGVGVQASATEVLRAVTERRALGPGRYCSPRLRYTSWTLVLGVTRISYDNIGICQALPRAGRRRQTMTPRSPLRPARRRRRRRRRCRRRRRGRTRAR